MSTKQKAAKSTRRFIQEFDHTGRHRLIIVDSVQGTKTGSWSPAGAWSKHPDLGIFSNPMDDLVPTGLYRLVPVPHEKLLG